MPVKFLPKTSSSEGRSSLGVVVLVIDRASGFMPGNLAIAASFDCILYNLWHCVDWNGRSGRSAFEANRQDLAELKRLRRVMMPIELGSLRGGSFQMSKGRRAMENNIEVNIMSGKR